MPLAVAAAPATLGSQAAGETHGPKFLSLGAPARAAAARAFGGIASALGPSRGFAGGCSSPRHQGTAGGAAFGRPIRLELGLPRAGLFTALLSFNTEVELGQAAIVALAAKVLVWLRGSRTFATAGLATGSAAIGAELVLLVSATR